MRIDYEPSNLFINKEDSNDEVNEMWVTDEGCNDGKGDSNERSTKGHGNREMNEGNNESVVVQTVAKRTIATRGQSKS